MNNTAQSQKVQEYSRIKNLIHLIVGDVVPFEWVDKYNCFQPVSINAKEQETKPSVSHLFYTNPNDKEKAKDHNRMYNELSWFRDICDEREPTKEEVKKAAEHICGKRQWLLIEKADGTRTSVEATAKGTPSYCKKLNGQILDALKTIDCDHLDCAFITATCDVKKYKSVSEAWTMHRELEVKPLLENLRKNYGVQYVDVVESTERGYPHTHILAFFDPSLFPELHRLKNETVLQYGKLYNYLNEHKHSTQVKTKVVRGKHKIHYLTKYVGKGCTSSVFKLLEEDTELKKDDWKLIKEFVFTTVFRLRKVHYTMKGSKKKQAAAASVAQASVSETERQQWESLTDAERRALLNSLCNNSLLKNPKIIYSMSYNEYKDTFGKFPERCQEPTDEFCDNFEKKGTLVYDEENLYTLFVDFVLSPKTAKLNRKFYWNGFEDIYDRFTDGYNLEDDTDFLKCCKDILTFYLKECMINGNKISDVIAGREGLTHVPYLVYKQDVGFVRPESFDPKDIYMTFEEWTARRNGTFFN